MNLKLTNARALVTGSSRGLGYAIGRGLAIEGCRVAINSRTSKSIQDAAQEIHSESGTLIVPIVGDVSDKDVPEQVVREAVKALGGLDILVTNTGGPPSGPFDSFNELEWQRAIDLAFMSHVRLIKAALPHLRSSKIASVLTLTSYSVKQPIPNLILSNSIRAATVGLTKSLALELGKDGIRFNSILPGWTKTERVEEIMTFRAQKNGTSIQEEIDRQAAESPFGRMAAPEEVANVAVFLASPAASYITGVMLPVDGGVIKSTM